MHDLHMGGLAAWALKRGGSLHPVLLPKSVTGNETGIMNPSIYAHKGKLLLNIRHINYILRNVKDHHVFRVIYEYLKKIPFILFPET